MICECLQKKAVVHKMCVIERTIIILHISVLSLCLLLSFDTFAKPPPTFRQHFLFPAGLPVDILDQQGAFWPFDPMQPLRWSVCSQSVFYRHHYGLDRGKKAN